MPNRFIKESICTSETINQLSAEEERLFYRLIVNCDDFGRMDARPEIIRSKCFPWKIEKIKIKDIEAWILRLAAVELILLYTNSGKRYLEFITWQDHQQVRANKSKYPGPCDDGSSLLSIDINSNQIHGDIAKRDRTRIRISNTNIEKEIGGMGGKEKTKYAENVSMTPDEYKKLIDKYGESDTKLLIDKLDNSKGSKGYVYKSDYRAILNWVVGEVIGKREKEKKSAIPQAINHTQRPPPTSDEIEKLCKL